MHCLSPRFVFALLCALACAACATSPTPAVLHETPATLSEDMPVAAFSTCKKVAWPPSASLREEQGVTSLALLVGADGKLRQAEVLSSSGSAELDAAAKAMMSSCRFVPAIVNGHAVERWGQTVYVWSIETDDNRPPRLVRVLSDRAAQGLADAQYALYLLLEEQPDNRAPDKAAALEGLLLHSAKGNYCPAKYTLGLHYEQGKTVARDTALARDWLTQAEACGHPMARQALEDLAAQNAGDATGAAR